MESSRVVQWMLSVVIASGLAVGLIPTFAAAQNGEKSGEDTGKNQRRAITFEKFDARLERPEGWVEASAEQGALVTLRAAGDRRAQIEIRASSPVEQTRRESFFNSFHSRLKDAGFVQQQARKRVEYADHAGEWTTYEGSSGGMSYRLVVWQLHRRQTAWLYVGFFPSAAGDRYVEDFKTLLDSLRFEED